MARDCQCSVNQLSVDQRALASGANRLEGGARGTCGGKGLSELNQPAIRRPASVSERLESSIEGGARGTCGGKGLPKLNQPAIRRMPAISEHG